MSYAVKEIFYSLQGEGFHAGRPAIFCRFAGCNLWSGRQEDRAAAVCTFCDTDFVGVDGQGGGRFDHPDKLASTLLGYWPKDSLARPFVILTGGEPALQADDSLIDALHAGGFFVAMESNGTLPVPQSIDWLCVSPKRGAPLVQESGQELKLVFPQQGIDPESFLHLDFKHFFIQPMDGPGRIENTLLAIDYCKSHPKWSLSLQIHKVLNIP